MALPSDVVVRVPRIRTRSRWRTDHRCTATAESSRYPVPPWKASSRGIPAQRSSPVAVSAAAAASRNQYSTRVRSARPERGRATSQARVPQDRAAARHPPGHRGRRARRTRAPMARCRTRTGRRAGPAHRGSARSTAIPAARAGMPGGAPRPGLPDHDRCAGPARRWSVGGATASRPSLITPPARYRWSALGGPTGGLRPARRRPPGERSRARSVRMTRCPAPIRPRSTSTWCCRTP